MAKGGIRGEGGDDDKNSKGVRHEQKQRQKHAERDSTGRFQAKAAQPCWTPSTPVGPPVVTETVVTETAIQVRDPDESTLTPLNRGIFSSMEQHLKDMINNLGAGMCERFRQCYSAREQEHDRIWQELRSLRRQVEETKNLNNQTYQLAIGNTMDLATVNRELAILYLETQATSDASSSSSTPSQRSHSPFEAKKRR
jgi:hypothetical protein